MAVKALPAQDVLNQLLSYNPETGKLFWKARPASMFESPTRCKAWNSRCAGKEAIHTKTRGYLVGPILGDVVCAHRVIWKMHFGEDPEMIDHINGQRDDNRLQNLRNANDQINGLNKAIGVNNSTGVMGVHWESRRKHWRVVIQANGRQKHIGSYQSKTDAIAARKAAERQFGYHPNHGRPLTKT